MRRLNLKNVGRMSATLAMLVPLVLMATSEATAYASTACPPTDAVWTNNAQFTGEPYPNGIGNYDGYNYSLNNDQYNRQTTSNQTMWLESDNDFGVCSYQPTSPSAVKAYPSADLNLADVVSGSAPASPDINTFNTISSTVTETQPASTQGSYQWMWDIFVGPTSPAANRVEIEIITNRDESGTPPGTSMGTANINGVAYKVYYTHALSDGHLYYEFVAQNNVTTATAHILGVFEWLNDHAPAYGLSFPLTQPLNSISGGWEINNVSNGSSGTEPFTVTSYGMTLSPTP